MAELELPFIKFLLEASSKQAKLLFMDITPTEVVAIAEVCYNILHGEVDQDVLEDLKPHRHLIRRIADKTIAFKERRATIVQSRKAVIHVLRIAERLLHQIGKE